MKQYLDICNYILKNGEWQDNRTGIKTLVVPNIHFNHDMKDGFPLLTTKKMAWKSMATELEGFIKGITSKKWYQNRGCNIWNEWANPKTVNKLWSSFNNEHPLTGDKMIPKKHLQKTTLDLGPIYGYQWRHFNAAYDEDDNGTLETYDQLDVIIKTLKENPDDRRMVCSAWNPAQLDRMALPPCHLLWRIVHINGTIHLHWDQRSCCVGLGVPFNIASYALLLELLCKETGMIPGQLSATFGNCHIYENYLHELKEQLLRTPKKLPTLEFSDWDGIYNWQSTDISFNDYNPDPKIKMEIAV